MKKHYNLIFTIIIAFLGLVLGIASKLFDIYSPFLGELSSRIAIWVLFGTLISFYSSAPMHSAINVFIFFALMLVGYYFTAEITNSVYGVSFIQFWSVITLISPIPAYYIRFARGKRIHITFVSIGIPIFVALSSLLLFDKIKISDVVIMVSVGIFLFVKGKKLPQK